MPKLETKLGTKHEIPQFVFEKHNNKPKCLCAEHQDNSNTSDTSNAIKRKCNCEDALTIEDGNVGGPSEKSVQHVQEACHFANACDSNQQCKRIESEHAGANTNNTEAYTTTITD